MKVSCRHCGRYHEQKFDCGMKPKREKTNFSDADKFRNTRAWRAKSLEIRTRDKGLCQICIRNLYNTTQQYNFTNIQVHHIIKLNVDISKGLDNDNLISLCKYHHDLADSYDIPIPELQRIAGEQEKQA